MKKIERLKLIEEFWKSKERRQTWETIAWEPFSRDGDGLDLMSTDKILMSLFKGEGYVFWTPGLYEIEGMEEFDWEWALLDLLNVWYQMPENWETSIFINEIAGAICIPHIGPDRLAQLFTTPDSVLLGMEHWKNSHEEMLSRYPGLSK